MPTNRAGKQVSNFAPFSLSRFHFLFLAFIFSLEVVE
jgi:hypothetical protein